MPRPKKSTKNPLVDADPSLFVEMDPSEPVGKEAEELVQEGQLVCRLTNQHFTATDAEETLQNFIEQFHREYRIEFEDMARDFRIACEYTDAKTNRTRTRYRTVSLAVFEAGKPHDLNNVIRVAVIKPSAKADEAAIATLDEILSNLSDKRDEVFGVWTNGEEMSFRMRTWNRAGSPVATNLTDFPAPDETLRRPRNGRPSPPSDRHQGIAPPSFSEVSRLPVWQSLDARGQGVLATSLPDLLQDSRRAAIPAAVLRRCDRGEQGRGSKSGR